MNSISFSALAQAVNEYIEMASRHGRMSTPPFEYDFNQLALDVFRFQAEHNSVIRSLCRHRNLSVDRLLTWQGIPAISTASFKEFDVSVLSAEERSSVFHSSGTTAQTPSRNFHSEESLAIYKNSLLPVFLRHLMPELEFEGKDGERLSNEWRIPMLSLTPSCDVASHSSLVFMLHSVAMEYCAKDSIFAGQETSVGWELDIDRVLFELRKSMCANRPIMIAGTAYNFIQLLDHFEHKNIRYRLAEGSRVMETGGYKGRTRTVPKEELYGQISQKLGIPEARIVSEYGMCELSSQAYNYAIEHVLHSNEKGEELLSKQELKQRPPAQARPFSRRFLFPPWVRIRVVSPETEKEVSDGEEGILEIVDLGNVASSIAIRTQDRVWRWGQEFELIGRVEHSEPRGCSLLSVS